MVKEYINKLQTENEEKILQLEEEKKKLENDLSCAQELKDTLIAEKQNDTSIFSPRTMDLSAEDKIREEEGHICQLQQQMDDLAQQREEAVRNRDEFHLLQNELESDFNSSVSKEFLQALYKKIETSLSLLNGNKNRCRSELRSALNMIRQFENQSDS